MPATKVGQLRARIAIQVATEVRDDAGQPVQTWADEATVWGEYAPATGQEFEVADQVRSVVTGRVKIRRYDGITAKKRLKVNGWGITNLILNIIAVMPPQPDGYMTLLTIEAPVETL